MQTLDFCVDSKSDLLTIMQGKCKDLILEGWPVDGPQINYSVTPVES